MKPSTCLRGRWEQLTGILSASTAKSQIKYLFLGHMYKNVRQTQGNTLRQRMPRGRAGRESLLLLLLVELLLLIIPMNLIVFIKR